MMRFLLSLAILVMACGLSFGQSGPGGGNSGFGGNFGGGGPGLIISKDWAGGWRDAAFILQVGSQSSGNFYGLPVNTTLETGARIQAVRNLYPQMGWNNNVHIAAFPSMYPSHNPDYPNDGSVLSKNWMAKTTPYFYAPGLAPWTFEQANWNTLANATSPKCASCVSWTVTGTDLQEMITEINAQIHLHDLAVKASTKDYSFNDIDGNPQTQTWTVMSKLATQRTPDTNDGSSSNQAGLHITALPNNVIQIKAHVITVVYLEYDGRIHYGDPAIGGQNFLPSMQEFTGHPNYPINGDTVDE